MRDKEIDKAIEVAKQYRTRSDLQKEDFHTYYVLKNNGLLDNVLPYQHPPLTYEKCYNAAKQFDKYSDFRLMGNKYYCKALKKGWITDYTWLQRRFYDMDAKIHIVYVYEFTQFNAAYIGRTMRPSVRKIQHTQDVNDSVYKFAKEKGISLGNAHYKVLKEKLTAEESQYYERHYIEEYNKNEWTLINKAKAGSLGGNVLIWNYETCYNEALKYNTATEFRKGCSVGYSKAQQMGWKDDYYWLDKYDPHVHYTYEECYNVALKCKNRNDFYKRFSSQYRYSKLNGFLDKFKWLYPKASNDNIIEYGLDGKLIGEHQNNDFKGNKRQSVLNCANGKHKYGYGRIWKYKSDVLSKEGTIMPNINGIEEQGLPIVQYSSDGHFIKEFKSIKSASEEIGCTTTSICDALKSIKTILCYGFAWRYKKDVSDSNKNIIPTITLRNDKTKRGVVLYDGNGQYIKDYSSLSKAYKEYGRYKVDWTLNELWKGSKWHKDQKRFNTIWKYKDEVMKEDGTIQTEIKVAY